MNVLEYQQPIDQFNQQEESRRGQLGAVVFRWLGWSARALFHVVLGLIVPAFVLAAWWYVSSQQLIVEQILPSPALVWQTFWDLIDTRELPDNLLISLQRIGWSVLIGGSVGLMVGFALGLSRKAYNYLYPTFNLIAQFPVIGWIPLLMIFLGIEESLKIAAISLAVIVPIMVSTYKSVLNVPEHLREVAKVYEFSHWQTLHKLIIPAALPNIVGGLRQGVMQAWLSLVFVELLASSEGIGYLIVWGRQLIQPDIVYMAIIVIGAVGFLLDNLLRLVEQHFSRWQRKAF